MARISNHRTGLTQVYSWAGSMALHALIFLVLLWVMGGNEGAGAGEEGSEVGIVVWDGETALASGGVALSPVATAPLAFSDLQVLETAQLDPITALETIRQTIESEAIIALDPLDSDLQMGDSADWTAVMTPSSPAGGGASFFGLEAKGGKFVYVVDYSGSMRGLKLQAAKVELTRSVGALSPRMRFYIMFYNSSFESMPAQDLVKATARNKRQHLKWAKGVMASSGTDPTEAMVKALSLKPDAIWLLSDGRFSRRIADAIGTVNLESGVPIHTISFYDRAGEAVLQSIARKNRGKYRFVAPPQGAR